MPLNALHANHSVYVPVLTRSGLSGAARLLRRAFVRLREDDGIELSGFIAYTGLVALFPFIIFLFALAGVIGQTARAQAAVEQWLALLPAEVAATLSPIVHDVLAQPQPGLLTFGIVGTLWVTSSGVEAMRMGFSRAYDCEETRPLWRRRLTSFGFVVLGALAALLFTTLMVVAPVAEQWLARQVMVADMLLLSALIIRLMLTVSLLSVMLAFFYLALPNHRIRWRDAWPGALLAACAWIVLASVFSLYLSGFAHYSTTYGSLGGVVVTLLFLQLSTLVFMMGAEVNAVRLFDE